VQQPETRYRGAVDVQRAADLYAQGRTLRQIGAELGLTATTVSQRLRRAGVTRRRYSDNGSFFGQLGLG
jgi:hypothetical protein